MDDRFEAAIRRFDEVNAGDPRTEMSGGTTYPRELLYSERMSARLAAFEVSPSEELRLAARCQHIERWVIPRSDYPMDRLGYRRWRSALAEHHAERAGEILAEVGYGDEVIDRVQDLLLKRRLKKDAGVQVLEDVICLVFIEHYLEDFARGQEEDKLITIIRKTWAKMSERGREAALELPLPPHVVRLVERALG